MKDNDIDILTCEYVKIRYSMASTGKRIGAYLIDFFIFSIFFLILIKVAGDFAETVLFEVATTILFTFRNMIMEYLFKGRTIGKYLLKIKVVNDECAPPNFIQCFLRCIIFLIDSTCFIGLILIAYKGQRLGDMATGCHVVNTRNYKTEKVNLDEDFKYTEPDYQVKYMQASKLNDRDIRLINNVLYNNVYSSSLNIVTRQVHKKIGVRVEQSDKAYLKQLVNDYNYLKQFNNSQTLQ